MRNIDWKIECRNIIMLLGLAGVAGSFFGLQLWAILAVALAYIAWTLVQLKRIFDWLQRSDGTPPPESRGIFGTVLDNIYRSQRLSNEERKKLKAEVQYLQDSFASLDDGAVMIDENGAIKWCNLASTRLMGLRYPGDTGRQIINLIRNPAFVSYFEAQDYDDDLQLRSPANDNLQLQVHVTFFGEGSRLMLVRDITQTNRLQKMRKDFVANVSHELRTPLTVINGYLETLADSRTADELLWRRAVDQMLTQSHRMEALIKDLMVLSRLESAPQAAEHDAITLRPMLEMIREEALASVPSARDIKITIECDDSLVLQGNSTELHSAINNLVVNAAKYSGDHGNIVIRWYRDQQSAYLQVEDHGGGIEAHHLPRLTERFYRVDNSRSIATGGTGLGLAIVKHILLHHQAELRIQSVVGKGSTFTCVFPLIRIATRSHSA